MRVTNSYSYYPVARPRLEFFFVDIITIYCISLEFDKKNKKKNTSIAILVLRTISFKSTNIGGCKNTSTAILATHKLKHTIISGCIAKNLYQLRTVSSYL